MENTNQNYKLKLKNNQIICKKVEEKMYSESDVIELCKKAMDYIEEYSDFHREEAKKDWIKQNIKK